MPSTFASLAVVKSNSSKKAADLEKSPLFLLAVLHSARRSKDRALEQVTRQKLAKLGVRIVFDDERPASNTTKPKGGGRG
jgi:hypothetical protein